MGSPAELISALGWTMVAVVLAAQSLRWFDIDDALRDVLARAPER